MIPARLFTIVSCLILLNGTTRAGELAGSVNVREGIVFVEVEDDGKPAVGVPVRLQEIRKKQIVAQGRINAEGKWSWPLLKAGSYEVVIGSTQNGQEPLVWPVDQRETVEPAKDDGKKCDHHPMPPPEEPAFPWFPIGLGVGLTTGGGAALWFAMFRGKRLGA